ncbi:MAG: HAMP domain-containing sensor histidine kinase [Clostridium sp.]|nr:HAMP domain-containing sensor histidine kinase [Clostridium sp.]
MGGINIILYLILLIIISALILYILYLQKQIKGINNQIENRIKENSIQPIRVQLINKNLNSLAANFNRILSIEEKLRVKTIKHEEKIKNMIANISHDLRTPLTAVKGYVQLLMKSANNKKETDMLNVSLNHINELEKLINSFFELSYMEISKPENNMKKINLTNLVADMAADYVYQFEEHNMEVIYKAEKPMFIYADEENTKRIVNNLIKNCIGHSNGNVEIDIEENENISLSFKNPVEENTDINAESLFDRFYIADKSRNKGSTGLGLSIVKLLAEQMGGKAEASFNNNILKIIVQFEKYIDKK